MKKILGVSLVALMAVSTARADIVSKAYVDVDQAKTYNVITKTAKTGVQIEELDAKMGALPADKTVAQAISEAVSGGTANVVTHDGAVGDATTPVYITSTGAAAAGTALGTMAYEAANNYYTKTAADAAFVEDADIADMQTTTNLSSSITTDTGSTTKYPSVAAVEAAISAADTAMDSRVGALETTAAALGTMANQNTTSYYTKTEADAAFVEDADIADMQTTTNLSSSIATDTGSTTKYPSVAAVEAAISSAAGNYDAAGTAAGLVEALDGGTISGSGVVTAISQADGQVSATLSQITNTEVASNAAIDLSKIAMPSLATINETGTVVLTAKAGTGEQAGQVVYEWETIQR